LAGSSFRLGLPAVGRPRLPTEERAAGVVSVAAAVLAQAGVAADTATALEQDPPTRRAPGEITEAIGVATEEAEAEQTATTTTGTAVAVGESGGSMSWTRFGIRICGSIMVTAIQTTFRTVLT